MHRASILCPRFTRSKRVTTPRKYFIPTLLMFNWTTLTSPVLETTSPRVHKLTRNISLAYRIQMILDYSVRGWLQTVVWSDFESPVSNQSSETLSKTTTNTDQSEMWYVKRVQGTLPVFNLWENGLQPPPPIDRRHWEGRHRKVEGHIKKFSAGASTLCPSTSKLFSAPLPIAWL